MPTKSEYLNGFRDLVQVSYCLFWTDKNLEFC